jgi:hypothetical protein
MGRAAEARVHFGEAFQLFSQDSYLVEFEAERLKRMKSLSIA